MTDNNAIAHARGDHADDELGTQTDCLACPGRTGGTR